MKNKRVETGTAKADRRADEAQGVKVMDNVQAIIAELRKHGLSNGATLGYHSGLMDDAADLIEHLQAYNEALRWTNKTFIREEKVKRRELWKKAVKEFATRLKKRQRRMRELYKWWDVVDVDDIDAVEEELLKESEK